MPHTTSSAGFLAICRLIVNLWKVTSRYEPCTEADAKKLYAAISDDPHGVLKWIQKFW